LVPLPCLALGPLGQRQQLDATAKDHGSWQQEQAIAPGGVPEKDQGRRRGNLPRS
jgi:hypothetical protein